MSDEGTPWTAYAIPLALLLVLGGIVVATDPGSWLDRDAPPPAPALSVDKTTMEPNQIRLQVTNEGQGTITISQILVDEAYWEHTITPDRTLDRMDSATVDIPYPWVQDEPVHITFIMSDGATVSHEIEAATTTPGFSAGTLGTYALIGLFVGVLPIAAGIAWYPAIERAGDRFEAGLLAFTIGLLAFLVLDSLEEALELAEQAPDPLGGPGLVLLGVAGAMAILMLVAQRFTGGERGSTRSRLVAAYLIATGIGLHNLGEGLAIGAATALGEVALGTFLILGFTLHNVTEGPAIVSPLERGTAFKHLAAMGIIAGVPTVFGAWLGGFAFSPLLGAAFFAIGAGAMLQVIVDVWGEVQADEALAQAQSPIVVGFVLGVAVMWGTGALI